MGVATSAATETLPPATLALHGLPPPPSKNKSPRSGIQLGFNATTSPRALSSNKDDKVTVGFGPRAWLNNSTKNSRRIPISNFNLLNRLPVNRQGNLVRLAGWWGKECKVFMVVKSCYALVFYTEGVSHMRRRRRSFLGTAQPSMEELILGDYIPDRIFVLRGATVMRNKQEEFELKCADGTNLQFRAEDRSSRDIWIASLHRAIHQGDAQLSDFESYAKLARGHFGSVQLVKHVRTGTALALKTIEMKPKKPEKQYHERAILELLQSGTRGANPFIAKLCFAFRDAVHLYLCTELASGGDLWALLRRTKRLSEATCRYISGELVLAVKHVHSHGVLHRDIKLENLLLDGQGHIKLVDFGLSKRLFDPENGEWDGRTFTICGTNYYMPPEMLLKSNPGHSLATDWWQVGCLIYELMSGVPAFYEKGAKAIHKKILDMGGAPPFPTSLKEPPSKACINIVDQFLVHDPSIRLGKGPDDGELDIKTHPFYRQINFMHLQNLRFPVPEEILRYLKGETAATVRESGGNNNDTEDEEQHEEGIIMRAFPESELFDHPKRASSGKYRKIKSLPSMTSLVGRVSSLSKNNGFSTKDLEQEETRKEPLIPVDLGPYMGYEFAVDDNMLADAKRGSGLHLSRWRGMKSDG